MHEKQLKLIKALSYRLGRRQGPWSADFIQNKGEGQIFLLHGPPGVGKTYTAECIAEYTGKRFVYE
jgi:DNA polymerase III delta prime subunit